MPFEKAKTAFLFPNFDIDNVVLVFVEPDERIAPYAELFGAGKVRVFHVHPDGPIFVFLSQVIRFQCLSIHYNLKVGV
jgi:hypothetical protein